MNILFLSELFYPHGGGAELATHLYASLLARDGFNVTVVTNRFAGEREVSKTKNLIVHRLPLFKDRTSTKYSLLQRLDVITSSFMRRLVKWATVVYIPRLWYAMIPLSKALRKPVVVHLHDYTPICPLALLYDCSRHTICESRSFCSARCIYQFEKEKNSNLKHSMLSLSLNLFARIPCRKLVEYADRVFCVSKAQKDILVKSMPTIMHKTKVIYNPLPHLSPIEIIGDDFGYLGGLNLLKGFGVLYKAMNCLNDHSAKVLVAGLPTLDERIVRWLSQIGMILHRKLNYDEQVQFYRQIRGVVFPSITPEPLPYVIAEAILRARIVIASKIGGIPEQTKNCKGVFLFEAGNYRQLAELLDYVKGLNRETILDLGYQNREVFAKTFTNKKTLDEFVNTLNHLI